MDWPKIGGVSRVIYRVADNVRYRSVAGKIGETCSALSPTWVATENPGVDRCRRLPEKEDEHQRVLLFVLYITPVSDTELKKCRSVSAQLSKTI